MRTVVKSRQQSWEGKSEMWCQGNGGGIESRKQGESNTGDQGPHKTQATSCYSLQPQDASLYLVYSRHSRTTWILDKSQKDSDSQGKIFPHFVA